MLDAMRGLAALAVVLLHVSGSPSIFERGYLAVDFFYILSGFVLTPVFERSSAHGVTATMLRRVARLWPMMATGTLMGLAVAVLLGKPATAALLAGGLLFLPNLGSREPVFPLNDPQWSLLAELVANFAHLTMLRRLGTPSLFGIAIVAWCGLLGLATVHGELTQGPFGDTWTLGLCRVAFGYTAGVILARTRHRWWPSHFTRLAWWLAPTTLVMILIGPAFIGIPARLADPVAVILFLPVVAMGARDQPPAALQRSAAWLGQLSFPVYALHFPLLMLARGAHDLGYSGATGVPLFIAVWIAIAFANLSGRSWLARGLPTGWWEDRLVLPQAGKRQTSPVDQRT
ncbi:MULTISPECIES: acyltransferase family protein [Novosphingobium]|uniref:acyltransferase family protein n=1 Tax=Novosphingobium TaxID=165696 RepID=UPI001CD457F3|nr:acyltransferase [Novosphingobium percolationis]